MRHCLPRTALSIALAALAPASLADGKLTVYSGDFDAVSQSDGRPGSGGFAMVERKVGFDLKAGNNEVTLSGLPRAIDASSVVLKLPAGVRLRAQRFDFAVAAQDELLRRALGQTVVVEQSVGDQLQTHTGVLMFAGNGDLTLRMPDGRIKVLSNYSSFDLPQLPSGMVSQPTLIWVLDADRAGRQQLDLNYSTAGLAWRAEYNANTRGQGADCRMSFDGAAMVVNRSGMDFNDVMLTLVAGEPQRVPSAGPMMDMATSGKAERAQMMVADSAPQAQASGEYQAYVLPNAGSLPQGSVQRLPLVDAASDVACERRYETNAQFGDWRPPHPIIDENFATSDGQPQPVTATLRFKNAKASGLGLPLPAGRVRMFEGRDFLGEANVGHTPVNQDVTLTIGNVFDLTAARSRTSFQLDRDGRTMTETVSVLLKNAKATPATVRVTERLGRWTDWELSARSAPFEKIDAQTIRFDVAVPAGGETRLNYTVRYRWAADVKIP